MTPALIVHGGCGAVPGDEQSVRLAACERAADIAWAVLTAGGPALDAVDAAVRQLENEPSLNAGIGSYLQADGLSRMDASVMTSDGRAGSVAQVPGIRHPIRLARYVLEQQAHVMLCGPEARVLALQLGHDSAVVATPEKIAYWQRHLDEASRALDYSAMAETWKRENQNPRLGTVGCVALDASGALAAATSTGGTGQCYPGRVGDTPVIGAGTYCTRQVGISMTGLGERILVRLSAKRLADLVADGLPVGRAARRVLDEIADQTPGSAGVIAIDVHGTIVAANDTPFLAWVERR